MTETAGNTPAEENTSNEMPGVPEDLAQCAMVVESAMEHLLKENHPPLAIASALLGGSLGLLARSMDRDTILHILDSAAHSVRTGEIHAATQAQAGSESEKA